MAQLFETTSRMPLNFTAKIQYNSDTEVLQDLHDCFNVFVAISAAFQLALKCHLNSNLRKLTNKDLIMKKSRQFF